MDGQPAYRVRAPISHASAEERYQSLFAASKEASTYPPALLSLSQRLLQKSLSQIDDLERAVGEQSIGHVADLVVKRLLSHAVPDGLVHVVCVHKGWSLADHDSLFQRVFEGASGWRRTILRAEQCTSVSQALMHMDEGQRLPDVSSSASSSSSSSSSSLFPFDVSATAGGSSSALPSTSYTNSLLLVIDNAEVIDPEVLRALLRVLSRRAQSQAITMLMGAPDGSEQRILGRVLDRSVSPFVRLFSIRLTPPNELYDSLLQIMFCQMSHVALLPSAMVVELMHRIFFNETLSVSSVLHFLRICLLKAVWKDPLHSVCSALVFDLLNHRDCEDHIQEFAQSLTAPLINRFRRLPSTRVYVEQELKGKAAAQKRFLKEDDAVREHLPLMLASCAHALSRLRSCVSLIQLTSKLLDFDLVPLTLVDMLLHLDSKEGDMDSSKGLTYWNAMCNAVLDRDVDGLSELLTLWMQEMENHEFATADIQELRDVLNKISKGPTHSADAAEEALSVAPMAGGHRSKRRRLEALVSSAQVLSQRVLDNADEVTQKHFLDEVRKDVRDVMRRTMSKHGKWISSTKSAPLMEFVLLDTGFEALPTFEGRNRTLMLNALGNPSLVYPNLPKHLSPSWPPVCIAYCLIFAEGTGNLVNLYDTYQSFREIYASAPMEALGNGNDSESESDDHASGSESDSDASSSSSEDTSNPNDDKVLQARFFDAIDQLHYMGLIKPTNRKTDHVIKTLYQ
jgi:hypothetical protein